ncbi:hypothetical protein BDZ89DRAFT_1114930 [Hymenopellis radicata]|nr:hypothetical protein BDZ89DRAFT_1114930 [Hymenopellis radicata]
MPPRISKGKEPQSRSLRSGNALAGQSGNLDGDIWRDGLASVTIRRRRNQVSLDDAVRGLGGIENLSPPDDIEEPDGLEPDVASDDIEDADDFSQAPMEAEFPSSEADVQARTGAPAPRTVRFAQESMASAGTGLAPSPIIITRGYEPASWNGTSSMPRGDLAGTWGGAAVHPRGTGETAMGVESGSAATKTSGTFRPASGSGTKASGTFRPASNFGMGSTPAAPVSSFSSTGFLSGHREQVVEVPSYKEPRFGGFGAFGAPPRVVTGPPKEAQTGASSRPAVRPEPTPQVTEKAGTDPQGSLNPGTEQTSGKGKAKAQDPPAQAEPSISQAASTPKTSKAKPKKKTPKPKTGAEQEPASRPVTRAAAKKTVPSVQIEEVEEEDEAPLQSNAQKPPRKLPMGATSWGWGDGPPQFHGGREISREEARWIAYSTEPTFTLAMQNLVKSSLEQRQEALRARSVPAIPNPEPAPSSSRKAQTVNGQQYLDPALARREEQLREKLAREMDNERAKAESREDEAKRAAVAAQEERIRLLEEELSRVKEEAARKAQEEAAEMARRNRPPPAPRPAPSRPLSRPQPPSDEDSDEDLAEVGNFSPHQGPITFASVEDLEKALREKGYCKLDERRKRSGSSTKAARSPSHKKLKAAAQANTLPLRSAKHARSPAAETQLDQDQAKKRRLGGIDDMATSSTTYIPAYLIKILADGWSEPIRFSEFTAEACAADRRRDLARDTSALRFNVESGGLEVKKGGARKVLSDMVLDQLPWLDASTKFCDGIENHYIPKDPDLPDGPELANQFRTILRILTSKKEWSSKSKHGFIVIKMYMETVLAAFWRSNLELDVSIFGQQTWQDCISAHTQDWMDGNTPAEAKDKTKPSTSTRFSFRGKQLNQRSSGAGSSSTSEATKKDKCCWCASWSHRWQSCPGGAGNHCNKDAQSYWVDAKGGQYCVGFNSNVGCKRSSRGKGCDSFFAHACSLCGSRDHGAQTCSK